MSTIEVNKISPVSGGTATTLGDSGDTFTVTSGATFNASSSNLANRPNAQSLIINGSMQMAQRGTSATGKTGSGYYTCDRWNMSASSLGTWTQTQDTDVPTGYGFANSLKMDCTTADASPGAGDNLALQYSFEGQNLQLLRKGTSNAQKTTISFWVKSVKTGTYICEVYDHDNSRTISTAYTISSGSTWEQKIINIPGDTSGALGNDNAQSLSIQFHLAAGSNYTSGTLNTSWNANVNANRMVGQVNLGDSTSNDFWITGVQMEVGEYTSSTLPPFQHDTYAENLARCQRYFNMICDGTQKPIGNGLYWEAQEVFVTMPINGSTMRTTPSIYQTTGTDYFSLYRNGAVDGLTELTINGSSSDRVISIYVASAQGLASDTKNRPCFLRSSNASTKFGLNAEL